MASGMAGLVHMDLTTCLDLSGVEEFKEDHPDCEVHDPIISFNTAGNYSWPVVGDVASALE